MTEIERQGGNGQAPRNSKRLQIRLLDIQDLATQMADGISSDVKCSNETLPFQPMAIQHNLKEVGLGLRVAIPMLQLLLLLQIRQPVRVKSAHGEEVGADIVVEEGAVFQWPGLEDAAARVGNARDVGRDVLERPLA